MDSNAVIDYFGNKLPESGSLFMDDLPAVISVITRIEILGWYQATPRSIDQFDIIYSQCTYLSAR